MTQKPDSPHLLIPKMKAQFLICIAENDDQKEPEAKNVLKQSFAEAKLPAEIEVYKAGHGWCPPDTKVYNQELSEKSLVTPASIVRESPSVTLYVKKRGQVSFKSI